MGRSARCWLKTSLRKSRHRDLVLAVGAWRTGSSARGKLRKVSRSPRPCSLRSTFAQQGILLAADAAGSEVIFESLFLDHQATCSPLKKAPLPEPVRSH